MRQGSRRGGVEADQWERGKPLPPMPGMQQVGGLGCAMRESGCFVRPAVCAACLGHAVHWWGTVPMVFCAPSMPHEHRATPAAMLQGGYDNRRGPPPGMRPMPGGPLPQLHKTQSAYKVRQRAHCCSVAGWFA